MATQSTGMELAALQNIVNETMRSRIEFLSEHPLPPPPPRRKTTRRERLRWRIRDARQTLALKLAPWLEDY